jgi:Fe(3+) dicitrate transport protein
MKITFIVFLFSIASFSLVAQSQSGRIQGVVSNAETQEPLEGVSIVLRDKNITTTTGVDGQFRLPSLVYGKYTLIVFLENMASIQQDVDINKPVVSLNFQLQPLTTTLSEVSIQAEQTKVLGLDRLNAVHDFGIYEGKKNEVVQINALTANLATNNARQIFGKITGLNIWESDGAGLQLGIGGRGLSPNRSSNFTTRQNGYDISADVLGYPESYYTPPVEALERIEVVRGAASLQYGTQFGGLVNFIFKKGSEQKKLEWTSRTTLGSWAFVNSFNSVGGTVAKGKLNYYAYFQYKRGDGYRENSGFNYYNAYASLIYTPNEKLDLQLDLTKMHYLAQQPGGLTDRQFSQNVRQSFRSRNWFKVDWNLVALKSTYRISPKTELNYRVYTLVASRQALGNLERINVIDFGGNRSLIDGEFNNIGQELRLLHRYQIGKNTHALVAGVRQYEGTTLARQGDANNQSGADFYFLNPEDVENSDYRFPNRNYAVFLENVFNITDQWSLTPGVRLEYIRTTSDGFYKLRVLDAAGNIVVENKIEEASVRKRQFVIAGLGTSFKYSESLEWYANISQNYRAINFSDLRIVNPNLVVDPDIRDEYGYTADLGMRKQWSFVSAEATLFYLRYNGKIGQVLRADQPPLFNDYRFRGNISDASTIGLETFAEFKLSEVLEFKKIKWTAFINTTVLNARYINSEESAIDNKKVELVPPLILRVGSQALFKSFSISLQSSWVAKHYSDATNAERSSTAVEGAIPAYLVTDLSLAYKLKRWTFEVSCNNLLNEAYFTRRADAYPGPGIIPSDGRSLYTTLQFKL